ncbi:hypothetical protein Tco_0605656 [Tanacetum coccineum]
MKLLNMKLPSIVKARLNEVATFLAAAAEEKQKRGHVLSYLTMGWSKQLGLPYVGCLSPLTLVMQVILHIEILAKWIFTFMKITTDSSVVPVVDLVPLAVDTKEFETDESAPTPRSPQTRARIAEHVAAPIPPTSSTYDQAPLGHRAAMIRMRDDIPKEDMPPRRRFVLTAPPPGCDVQEKL